MTCYEFEGFVPAIDPSSYIHPDAVIIGNVVVGRNVYVGPHAVLRGDFGAIDIEDGCNVQETCVIHMFPGVTVTLKRNAHIGHGAVIHGAKVCENALIGMNAVVMDNAVIGAGSIVGALCFVPSEMIIPERKVVVGNPAKILKDVTDEMTNWKAEGTHLYQELCNRNALGLKEVTPLYAPPADRKLQRGDYKTLKGTFRGRDGD